MSKRGRPAMAGAASTCRQPVPSNLSSGLSVSAISFVETRAYRVVDWMLA
jgi:hypothetical protein